MVEKVGKKVHKCAFLVMQMLDLQWRHVYAQSINSSMLPAFFVHSSHQ